MCYWTLISVLQVASCFHKSILSYAPRLPDQRYTFNLQKSLKTKVPLLNCFFNLRDKKKKNFHSLVHSTKLQRAGGWPGCSMELRPRRRCLSQGGKESNHLSLEHCLPNHLPAKCVLWGSWEVEPELTPKLSSSTVGCGILTTRPNIYPKDQGILVNSRHPALHVIGL